MNEFTEYILQFGNLNQQQMDFISKKANEAELRKDEYFAEAGKVSSQVGFITDGIIRVCYYNNKREEITRYFFDENHLILHKKNFDANIAASEYLQAISDCKLTVFSKQDIWQTSFQYSNNASPKCCA